MMQTNKGGRTEHLGPRGSLVSAHFDEAKAIDKAEQSERLDDLERDYVVIPMDVEDS